MSHFEALEAEIPATEARRQMRAAQAAAYPHLRREGAERLWRSWSDIAYRPHPEHTAPVKGALFSLNGQAVSFDGLRAGLRSMLGGGAVTA